MSLLSTQCLHSSPDTPGGTGSSPGTESGSSATGTTPTSTASDLAPSATHGKDFTIQRPTGNWVLDHHELQKPGYIETRWHLAGQPNVIFLVDHTPGFKGTAQQGAEGVSHLFKHASSYRQLGFAATHLPAGEGWRWEYESHGRHSVDTFLMSCNTGYAVRGSAPDSEWSSYSHAFEEATSTLTPTCG